MMPHSCSGHLHRARNLPRRGGGGLVEVGQNFLAGGHGQISGYETDLIKGKVKSIGNAGLTYYSSMDDKAFAGKIKSFNGTSFMYYSSVDQPSFRGALKSGNQFQMVNGVAFKINCY